MKFKCPKCGFEKDLLGKPEWAMCFCGAYYKIKDDKIVMEVKSELKNGNE